MRNIHKFWTMAMLAFALVLAIPQKSNAQYSSDITFQTFYDELAPYGTWIYDRQYGDVWLPDVPADFRPYSTDGYWAMTAYGNTWVSDFEWGWAPFHYGRWLFDNYYGWIWIPGYEWGPAWVNWRVGGGYYGWAPLGPGVGIDMTFNDNYYIPYDYWSFAPYAYINSPYISSYYAPFSTVNTIFRNTRVITNTYAYNNYRYVTGPRPVEIQRYTRNRPVIYNIRNSNRPGLTRIDSRNINIYRPTVQRVDNVRPTRVVDATAYRNANPNQRIAIGETSGRINRDNASRLINYARTAQPDNRIVREPGRPSNDNRGNNGAANDRPNSDRGSVRGNGNAGVSPVPNVPLNPADPAYNPANGRPRVSRTDGQPTPVTRPGQPVMNDQQVQPQRGNGTDGRGQQQYVPQQQNNDAARQQQELQRRQQEQVLQQQRNMDRQQAGQDVQQRWQRQQQDRPGRSDQAVRQQQEQQRQQQEALQRQQQDAQRQQQEQARQQQEAQQRQQQEQQRQQQEAQRQQQERAQRQQQEQQRQQQEAQQRQQQEQQRQQQEAQRQQQERAQRQQQEQQRQQQEAQQRQQQEAQQRQQQEAQQRQQQEAQQRQQQEAQQRQQQEQQRQQQQQQQQRQQQEQQRQQGSRPTRQPPM